MSLFSPQASCGLFGGNFCGQGMEQAVSFVRAGSLLQHRAATQNAAGEILLSFIPIGPFTLNVQPAPAGYSRMVAGILVQVDMYMFSMGSIDVQEGDRCYLNGAQLEVTNVLRYGHYTTELECREIGR